MAPISREHYEKKLQGHASLAQVARASVMWAYLRTGVFSLLAIPTTIILARLLTPADFGIAAAAMFFGQLASRLATSGMGSALVRVKELRDDHISTVFVINALMGGAGALGLVLLAPYIGSFYGSPQVASMLPVVALTFVFGSLSTVQQALLSRDMRYREMAFIGSVHIAVTSTTAVVLAWNGWGFWSLALGEVAGAFAKWMYGIKVAGLHVHFRLVPAAARELSSFAVGSYARRLLEQLTMSIDQVVIGRLLGIDLLGYYDKAFSSANRVYEKLTVVGPAVSFRIFAIIQDEPQRFRRAFRKVTMTVSLLGYVVFGTLIATAPHLIVVALGEKWRPSVLPFQILCGCFCLRLMIAYASAAAQARGWIWPQVWRQGVQVVCTVGLVYLSAPWGIVGAAWAILVSTTVMVVLTQGMLTSATGLGWADVLGPQVPALSCAGLIVAGLIGMDLLWQGGDTGALILQTLTAALITLLFAWMCPFLEVRVLMYEALSDVSPRLAGRLWRDVATQHAAGGGRVDPVAAAARPTA